MIVETTSGTSTDWSFGTARMVTIIEKTAEPNGGYVRAGRRPARVTMRDFISDAA
jgi:hypothetical protein